MNRDIVIKTDVHSKFLRTEAVCKAIEYEDSQLKNRKSGPLNGIVHIKYGTKSRFDFLIYHTKTSIVVSVEFIK